MYPACNHMYISRVQPCSPIYTRAARKQIGAKSAVLLYSQVALALLLCWLGGDRLSWRWPFRREHVLGRFGCFGVAGWLSCILPVFHATKWVCAVP